MYRYRTKSAIDGKPIVVLVTGVKKASKNRKTGALIQVSFLSTGANPLQASKRGLDRSVCGDCPERRGRGGRCYVQLKDAILGMYRAFRRGRYRPIEEADDLDTRGARFGMYGDAGALSKEEWDWLRPKFAPRPLSFSHQWRARQDLRAFCMASVASAEERLEAKALGWRTARIAPKGEKLLLAKGEIVCPALTKGITCDKCRLCFGVPEEKYLAVTDVVFPAHGGLATRKPATSFDC